MKIGTVDRDAVMRQVFAQRGLAMRIAATVGISHQSVQMWKKVPAEHVLDIAVLLGKTPERIRPDVFNPRKGKWVWK